MFLPLDGPSAQLKVSVTAATVVEVKVGGAPLIERKVITLQPEGRLYVYFGDGVSTPNAATVIANGLTVFKDALVTYEASEKQPVFILSVSGTINVVIVERA